MCGIAGALSTNYKPQKYISELMGNSLFHRGPDAIGQWHDESAGILLVHRRLSILDLSSAGSQPMRSQSGRYVIVFNGEIYNHLNLRKQLESEVSTILWKSHSDTETLLECLSFWGIEKTLKNIIGMFSIALWDTHERTLMLARDRMGEKPLYWGWCNNTLLFGSEIKALKQHPAFNAEIDRNALTLYFRHNYIPAPYSIYQGINKLHAGHYIVIRQNQNPQDIISKPYWNFNEIAEDGISNPFVGSNNEAINHLEYLIKNSVSSQMISDVPIGAFLSGGIDSSTIVSIMQQYSRNPIKTFAIGFDEQKYNEAIYAREVADYLGTDHTELYVNAQDALSVIPKLPKIYCEPFADSSQIPTYLVSQLAKQHVTVALSGDAGDELFGGYTPYQFAPNIWNKISKLPISLRKLAVSLLSDFPLPDKINKLLSVLPSNNREQLYSILMSHWQNSENLVIGSSTPLTFMTNVNSWPITDSFEHWMMAIDTKQYMIDNILVKVDRAAMANSLETRIPLLDPNIIKFAWQLPLSMKIRKNNSKWILREVLYRHVPKNLIERPKKGFSIPIGQWLKGPLKEWADTLLNSNRLSDEGFLNSDIVNNAWKQHIKGTKDHSYRLWSVLMFQAWLEENTKTSVRK
ncbi:asparagine synthase (glutamine-hydrolyzing) [Xenorhabdus sp. Reich]|uniref:asparagine synthase (glutamine-hydrolyzing) n=1 Tax=Xenorhabdus littoralis TaxID=2582835 RepID=A0ABU4SJT1_9GAMM|nr:asparagine synthase (glutamine-hydrolyzing) [Xenorhabdus sp. Reich]MDX7998855.1 asparagine synthase (glutamine-hydrolyzing) [Xenorhabdus sp. Reich]